jgi:hypothetical protein
MGRELGRLEDDRRGAGRARGQGGARQLDPPGHRQRLARRKRAGGGGRGRRRDAGDARRQAVERALFVVETRLVVLVDEWEIDREDGPGEEHAEEGADPVATRAPRGLSAINPQLAGAPHTA